MSDARFGSSNRFNGRHGEGAHGPPHDAESIRLRMAELRHNLEDDAALLTQKAQHATHLSFYVRKFPFVCMGLALGIGFALVPRKKSVLAPTDEQLERLVRKGEMRLYAKPPEERPGFAKKAVLAAGALATRAAVAYVGQQIAARNAGNGSSSAPETS